MSVVSKAGGGRPAVGVLSRAPASFRLRNESLNIVRLRRIFDLFDQNGDGEITPEEISAALDRLGLGADEPTELARAVEAYLRPGCAGLDFDDFQALHRSLGDALFGGDDEGVISDGKEEDADMAEAFKVFDEDGDGFISAAELHAVLGKLGLPEGKSMARVREMICSVDRNNDGRVDFYEFKHMMLGICPSRPRN